MIEYKFPGVTSAEVSQAIFTALAVAQELYITDFARGRSKRPAPEVFPPTDRRRRPQRRACQPEQGTGVASAGAHLMYNVCYK
jgi:hypothetical protein